jgi:hypothetical protein
MSAFEPIVAATGRALRPLQRAFGDEDSLRALLNDLGWEATPGPDDLERVTALFPVAEIDRAIGLAMDAVDRESMSAEDLVELVALISQIAGAIAALDDLSGDDLDELSGALADPALWADLSLVLAEYLLIRLLDSDLPAVALGLRLTGVITWEVRGAYARLGRWRFAWEQLGTLFTDPVDAIRRAVGWPQPSSVVRLLGMMQQALGRLGVPATMVPMVDAVRDAVASGGHGSPTAQTQVELILARGRTLDGSPFEAGVVAASAATATEPTGLYVGNLCSGAVSAGASTGIWSIEVSGAADGTATVGAIVRPDGTAAVTDMPSGEVGIVLTGTPGQPWRLFGTATSTRVEVGGVSVGVGLMVDGATAEPWVSVGTVGEGLEVVLDFGGADTFLASVLGGAVPTFSFAGELRLGSTAGLTVSGSLGLEFDVPVNRQIGPIYLDTVTFGLAGSPTGLRLDLSAAVDLVVGPFTATAEGIGTTLTIDLQSGGASFAGVGTGFGFRPPSVLGFQLETEAARGGGLVWIDAGIGRYSGALSLDIVSIGIDALVVIDTELPGDPDGWAFFASLAASFPGIPLGFGFTLTGAGGIIALNRTMDGEALAAGLRAGVVDALLFPDDPVGAAADLIAQIDEYFPLKQGSTVIGPVIEIGWGSPTLVTGQLGVMISLPDGLIVVLGSVAAVLPAPEAPALSLHMDTLGVIDIPGGTFSLLASLYDSQLLETIQLSGDMAMYLQVGAQPYFLLSVGGYHPGFQPPSLVPPAMHDLRRMQASIEIAANLTVSVQTYFAVTSNSVQFGASVNVVASVEVLLATYTAKGWFTFDVLLVFSPFAVSARMSAGVGVYSGDKELMGVQLSLLLEGPKPWYAIGTASFRFFGLKVNFDLQVGGEAAGEPKPIAHPRAGVLAALATAAAWVEVAPVDALGAAITYAAPEPDDTTTWVRPDHQVAVRQSVAPLNRTLEIVGQAVPADGEELVTVTGAGIGRRRNVEWSLADDWFAPAQFEQLGNTERLSRESFEMMNAGVTFGSPGVEVTGNLALTASATTDYEIETWEPGDTSLERAVLTSAAAHGLRYAATIGTGPMFTIAPTSFTVVLSIDGTEAVDVLADTGVPSGGASQYDARAAVRAVVARDPGRSPKLMVVASAAAARRAN